MSANPRFYSFSLWREFSRVLALLAVGIFCAFGSASIAQASVVAQNWGADNDAGGIGYSGGTLTGGVAFYMTATSSFYLDSVVMRTSQTQTGTIYLELGYEASSTWVTYATSSGETVSAVNCSASYCDTTFEFSLSVTEFIHSGTSFGLRANCISNCSSAFTTRNGGGADFPMWKWDGANWSLMSGGANFKINGTTILTSWDVALAEYNASNTPIVCTGVLDIDCQITKALSFLFYPSYTVDIFNSAPTIASTTPFAYIWELSYLWDNVFTGTATGTQSLTLTFAPAGSATSTLSANALSSIGSMHSFFTAVRGWIEIFFYILFGMGILYQALHVIGWVTGSSPSSGGQTMARVRNVGLGIHNRYKL